MNPPGGAGEGVAYPSEEGDQPLVPELSVEDTIAKWKKLLGPEYCVYVSASLCMYISYDKDLTTDKMSEVDLASH